MTAEADAAPPTKAEAEAPVARQQRGLVSVITLQYRPYNLMGPTLMGALLEAFAAARQDGARAILIRSGLRHFSGGADLNLFDARVERGGGSASPRATGVEFLHAMEALPVPVVAAVHGVCLGGGLELALACDFIVAAASAKIGSVEVGLGLNPLLGGVQRQVQRIGAARAKEMSMLGRRYDPTTLERWGLINRVVADEALDEAAFAIADELAHGPTLAHAATKALVEVAVNEGVAAADARMAELQAPIWASEDLKIGLASFRRNGPGQAKFDGR
jgi:enoyl-CoA hydratase/carnithine racemase